MKLRNCTQEQVVIAFRWLDSHLIPHEDFVSLYLTDSTISNALVSFIKDVLVRMNLNLKNCRASVL